MSLEMRYRCLCGSGTSFVYPMRRNSGRRVFQGVSLPSSASPSLITCLDTCRTSTPLRVEHEIAVKIFFSVQGETRQGEPMADCKQPGEVRMLVISVPVVIASVSSRSIVCISSRATNAKAVLLHRTKGQAPVM